MRYTSDMSESQWEIVKSHLGKPGNKSKYEKRELVNAVLYVVKTGCQWRNIPSDFPKGTAVYQFYKRMKLAGIWDKIQKDVVKMVGVKEGRTPSPSYGLIDSQSVKTCYASEEIGIDGGEKTKGRKRHIVTDTMGNLLCIHVHAANKHDTKAGVYTFEKALYRYPSIQAGCADQGYRGTFKNIFEWFHNIKIDISERIKGAAFEVQPIRWVVERTFAWFNNSRRLSKDYEILSHSEETMCIISNLATLLKRF